MRNVVCLSSSLSESRRMEVEAEAEVDAERSVLFNLFSLSCSTSDSTTKQPVPGSGQIIRGVSGRCSFDPTGRSGGQKEWKRKVYVHSLIQPKIDQQHAGPTSLGFKVRISGTDVHCPPRPLFIEHHKQSSQQEFMSKLGEDILDIEREKIYSHRWRQ